MEPILDNQSKKKVPVVIWSNGTSPTSDGNKILSEKLEPFTISFSPSGDSNKKLSCNNNHTDVYIGNGTANGEGVKFLNSEGKVIRINSDDSICSSSTASKDLKKPKVPDGGWGWVVVFSSLVISMIADGISFSFGLLYIEFLNYFQESKSKTSWIGSLFMAVPLLSGPVMSALVDRYGCRSMTMLGGLISGIGFVIASFGDSIEWEFIFFGVVAGLGLGLCYVTAVVSIAYWFDKYRTLAVGLGACGTGIGTFVYAPMTTFFIEEYGWRGAVLLLAGTFFNMCVCGALMRDPEWWTLEQTKQSKAKSVKNESSCGSISGLDGDSLFPDKEEIRTLLKNGQSPEYILTTLVTKIEKSSDSEKEEQELPTVRSVVNLPTFIKQNEKVPLEVLELLSSNKALFRVILENYPSLLHCRSLSDEGKLSQLSTEGKPLPVTMSMKLKRSKNEPTADQQQMEICSIEEIGEDSLNNYITISSFQPNGKQKWKEANGVILGKEVDQNFSPGNKSSVEKRHSNRDSGQHYLRDIRLHRNSVMYRGAMLNIPRYRLRASSCPDILRNSMTTLAKENQEKWYADALELFKTMFDFSMFNELHFLLMSLATILLFIWFIVPYFYLAEHLTRHGYNEVEASFLLSIIGVANCLGMIGLGWAGDQPWMDVTKTYAACLVLCGACCILMPLITHSYNLLAAVCALFGLFFASNYSFTPSILVQLIPLERFTTAYGLILLCQGIGNLIGPPLAGWIFDEMGEWDVAFYQGGGWIIFSGVLVIFIKWTKNRKILGSGTLEINKSNNM